MSKTFYIATKLFPSLDVELEGGVTEKLQLDLHPGCVGMVPVFATQSDARVVYGDVPLIPIELAAKTKTKRPSR